MKPEQVVLLKAHLDRVVRKDKWDRRFLALAEHIASWSKDPSTKVGAVIVDDDRRILGTGYNGFPRRMKDNEERYANREEKYKLVVHGEINAILNSAVSLRDATLYTWPFLTCSDCARIVIQSGIARVVSTTTVETRWAESFALARNYYEEAGVEVCLLP